MDYSRKATDNQSKSKGNTMYQKFAEVYEKFMRDIPYEKWSSIIINQLREQGIEKGIVCDLGCGTGIMTRLLHCQGYDMIGVDSSEEMLMEASSINDEGILYLNQDICELDLFGTVSAFYSICDTMNYLLDEEAFLGVLQLVNNFLEPGGIFVFDLKTEYLYREKFGDSTFSDCVDDHYYIWNNLYDEEDKINEYSVTFFINEEGNTYTKYEEQHYQRAYSVKEITSLIEQSGMKLIGIYDEEMEFDFSEKESFGLAERVIIVLQECGK